MELRKLLDARNGGKVNQALCDAEDLITRLRAENERLRDGLNGAKGKATSQYKGGLYPDTADGWEYCVSDMLSEIEDALK